MRPFAHFSVRSVEEACQTLGEWGWRARVNAGGSDLLTVLNGDFLPAYPEAVIDLKPIRGLDSVEEDGESLRIGALTTLAAVVRSPLLQVRYPLLVEAARTVGTPQIRNVATVGGNLCQDVRCWYYRYPRKIGGPIPCVRKGGSGCRAVKGDNRYHAIMGGRRCFAVCPSDLAVALAALDGKVIISGPRGERRVALPDFYSPLGNCLASDEIVREIEVPIGRGAPRQTFSKFTLRKPVDFAIVSVAAALELEAGTCTRARIALGAVAPSPVRATGAEEMLTGQPLTRELARLAAEAAVREAKPLSRNGYKVQIAKALVERELAGAS
ncbi:MAG: FAD binding domain-containing protein [Deltaproteobacteria bacterium]|nr:FAD binding domain-containing protein [Deltaproteobacteria bacterium]